MEKSLATYLHPLVQTGRTGHWQVLWQDTVDFLAPEWQPFHDFLVTVLSILAQLNGTCRSSDNGEEWEKTLLKMAVHLGTVSSLQKPRLEEL